MKAYCFSCGQWEEYIVSRKKEQLTIDGVSVIAEQKHAFCNNCHEEVFPDEIADENISIAHDAYREAKGSISVSDIQFILDIYDIGARPLSLLLGWGENSIERQMKHTIPDKVHADQLKQLFDPYNMVDLIAQYGYRISDPALNKVIIATIKRIRELQSTTTSSDPTSTFIKEDWKDDSRLSTPNCDEKMEKVPSELNASYQNSPRANYSMTNPFNYSFAA